MGWEPDRQGQFLQASQAWSSAWGAGRPLPFDSRETGDGGPIRIGRRCVRRSGTTCTPAMRLPKPRPNLDAVFATTLFLGNEQFLANEDLGWVANPVGIDDPLDLGTVLDRDAADGFTFFHLVDEPVLRVVRGK